MKKMSFAFIAIVVLFSCQERERVSQESLFGKDVAKQKGDVFEDSRVKTANPSVMHFNEAITSFEKGELEVTSTHIKAGADALANEGKFLKGEDRKHLEDAIRQLEQLSEKVKKWETTSIDDLMQAFGAAQVAVVQEYIVDFDEFLVRIPEPSSYYPHLKAAIKAVASAEPYLSASLKAEAQLLVKNSEELLNNMDRGRPISEDQIRKDRSKLENFITAHHLAKK